MFYILFILLFFWTVLPHDLAESPLVYQDPSDLVGFIQSDDMLARPVKLFIVDFISTAVSWFWKFFQLKMMHEQKHLSYKYNSTHNVITVHQRMPWYIT